MEIFKKIAGYEGLYIINTSGMIINHRHKIIKNQNDNRGYLNIGLTKNGKRKFYKIHRLIAEAFIPNPHNKPFINHVNGIKNDNRIENLEWCTNQENIKHAYNTDLIKPNRKLNNNEILEIRNNTDLSQRKLAEIYKVSQSVIRDIKSGKTYKKPSTLTS